jgi:hypothetical protein
MLFFIKFVFAGEETSLMLNPLIPQVNNLTEQELSMKKMNDLKSEIELLEKEIHLKSTFLCCNYPSQNAIFREKYKQVTKKAIDSTIISHQGSERLWVNKSIWRQNYCKSIEFAGECSALCFVISSTCSSTTIIPSLILPPICFVASLDCMFNLTELTQIQAVAQTQLATKQLYLTGQVDEKLKHYLKDNKNAFYMRDRHGNFVSDK